MKIRVEFSGDATVVRADLAQASAPIVVGGVETRHQTADARHRTDVAVLLAARLTWPEEQWPDTPDGSEEIEPTEAWDALLYSAAP